MSTAEQTKEQTKDQSAAETPKARATFPGPHKTIAAALVAAQLNAKAVEKDATNEWHKYAYASAEAVIAEARYALNLAGLATIMERWELLPPVVEGGHRRVKVYFLTIHADSNDTLKGEVEYDAIPEKGRPEDKAVAGALTYAESYYLRGLLCLPRVAAGEEPDRRNDTGYDPSQRSQGQRQGNRQRGNQQRGQQGGQHQGNGQRREQQQRPPQQGNGQSANGQQQAKPPAGSQAPPNGAPNGSASNGVAPTGESKRSERYTWWRARIVNSGLPAGQLRGMCAAIKKDSLITDETERTQLAELAEREAVSIESAAERASTPPQ